MKRRFSFVITPILFCLLLMNFFGYSMSNNSDAFHPNFSKSTNIENIMISNNSAISYHIGISANDDTVLIDWDYIDFSTDPMTINSYFRLWNLSNGHFQEQEKFESILGQPTGMDSCIDEKGNIYLTYVSNGVNFAKSVDGGNTFHHNLKINGTYDLGTQFVQNKIFINNNNLLIIFRTMDTSLVFISNDYGLNFKDPIEIPLIIDYSISIDDNGFIYIFSNHDTKLTFIKSTDNGEIFSEPIQISPPEHNVINIDSISDSNNYLYISWIDRSTGYTYMSKSIDGGLTFVEPIVIEDHHSWEPQSKTNICVDEWGGVYVVWCDSIYGDNDIFLSYSLDGGSTFSQRIKVIDDEGNFSQSEPDASCDSMGNLHIVWKDSRDEYDNVYYTMIEGMNHPPNLLQSFPSTIVFQEDIDDNIPMMNLTEYFDDDHGYDSLSFRIFDKMNSSKFDYTIHNNLVSFNHIIPDIFGNFSFSLIVTDTGLDGIPENDDDNTTELFFTLNVLPINDPPEIISINGIENSDSLFHFSITEEQWFNGSVQYSDVDSENITFDYSQSLPGKFSENSTSNFSYFPDESELIGTNMTIIISDGFLSNEVVIEFEINYINDAPICIFNETSITVIEDFEPIFYNLSEWFSDQDNDILMFSLISGDVCSTFIENTTVLSIFSLKNRYGSENFTLIASDGENSIFKKLIINILPINDEPYNVSILINSEGYYENQEQIVTGKARDIENDNLNFTWIIDGQIIGNGDEIKLMLTPGEYNLTLRVSDGNGGLVEISEVISIKQHKHENNDNAFKYTVLIIIISLLFLTIIAIFLLLYLRRNNRMKEEKEEKSLKNIDDIASESTHSYEQ